MFPCNCFRDLRLHTSPESSSCTPHPQHRVPGHSCWYVNTNSCFSSLWMCDTFSWFHSILNCIRVHVCKDWQWLFFLSVCLVSFLPLHLHEHPTNYSKPPRVTGTEVSGYRITLIIVPVSSSSTLGLNFNWTQLASWLKAHRRVKKNILPNLFVKRVLAIGRLLTFSFL